jgi:hypothetical protein
VGIDTSRYGHYAAFLADDLQPACADKVVPAAAVGEGTYIDFGHIRTQLSLQRVLGHLGLTQRLRGSGPQRRCACPIHRADGRGRTFSVNLKDNVFTCFDAHCGKLGDVIEVGRT